jgi:hypothetical protein
MSDQMLLAIGRAIGMLDGLYETCRIFGFQARWRMKLRCAGLISHDRALADAYIKDGGGRDC